MSVSYTLESLQTEFARWRENKPSPQCHAPEMLRKKAVSLLSKHTPKEISKALKISRERLSLWQKSTSSAELLSAPEFVAMDTLPQSLPREVAGLHLSGCTTSGTRWSLQGDFSPAQLQALIAALTAGNGAAL